MVKLVVAYSQPENAAAFDEHYENEHVPLVQKVPNLKQFEAARVIATPDGSLSPFYLVAELWFDDPAVLQEAIGSPEGKALAEDVEKFASGGATMMIAEVL